MARNSRFHIGVPKMDGVPCQISGPDWLTFSRSRMSAATYIKAQKESPSVENPLRIYGSVGDYSKWW